MPAPENGAQKLRKNDENSPWTPLRKIGDGDIGTGTNYSYLNFLSMGEIQSMGKRPPAGVARRRESRAGRGAAGALSLIHI